MSRHKALLPLLTALAAAIAGPAFAAGQGFQIGMLSTDGCQVVDAPISQTRGGIAVGTEHVFYTGAAGTVGFLLSDLAQFKFPKPVRYDGLASNLRTGTLYNLGSGGVPITYPGGMVTQLLELDPASLELTGQSVALSHPVPATLVTGIFAGYDRVVLHTDGRVYDVALPSGEVTDRGPLALDAYFCRTWAFWGVAELWHGALHLVYREGSSSRIVRTRVGDGLTTAVADFAKLGDVCSLSVSLAEQRWYFQHDFWSQLSVKDNSFGACDAVVSAGRRANLSLATDGPDDRVTTGKAFTYAFTVTNEGPARATGVRFEGRLSATLELLSAEASQGRCRPGCEATVCELGALRAGASATITLDVRPLRGGLIRTSASVFSRRIDPDPADNESVVETTARPGRETLFSITSFGQLLTLDANDGTALDLLPLTLPEGIGLGGSDLGTHPFTGELWALIRPDGAPASELVTLDPETGEVRSVGAVDESFFGLQFDNEGTLFATTRELGPSLYTLDQTDATSTFVVQLTSGRGGWALGFHPRDGLFYHLTKDGVLQQVDASVPAVTEIPIEDHGTCSLEFDRFRGALAWTHLGDDSFLVSDLRGRLYRLTTSGRREAVGTVVNSISGLAWAELGRANVAIRQSGHPDPVTVGTPLTYSMTVRNDGPKATGVTVFDPVPGTASVLSAEPSQGSCYRDSCGELTCPLGELEAGASATVAVQMVPWAEGTLVHEVSAPRLADPDPDDNHSVIETTVAAGDSPKLLYSINYIRGGLRRLDPMTGRTLATGPIAVEGETVHWGHGLAAHPDTGELWALLTLAGQEGRELAAVDPFTFRARRVGNTGDSFAALAFDADGTLYAATDRRSDQPHSLFILSQSDATPTFVSALDHVDSESEALVFSPVDGRLYRGSGWLGMSELLEAIDPSTLVREQIYRCGRALDESTALTHLGGSVLLLTDEVFRYYSLTTDGVLKRLGFTDHLSKGLAWVTDTRPPLGLSLRQRAAPTPAAVGEKLTYVLTVTNEGRTAARGVQLFDALTGLASLVSASPSKGTCASAETGELICDLGKLGRGSKARVKIVVELLTPGLARNRAWLTAVGYPDLLETESVLETTVLP